MARADGRVQPGQRLDSAFSARAWNRAQDAADLVLASQRAFLGGEVNAFGSPYTALPVVNGSLEPVARWHALQIDGLSLTPNAAGTAGTPQFEQLPVIRGRKPSTSGSFGLSNSFAVAIEPIAPGAIGRCAVAGVVQLKCDIANTNDDYVRLQFGSWRPITGGVGEGFILWKEAGTGSNKWALVRLGVPAGAVMIRFSGAWSLNTTKVVTVLDTADSLTVINRFVSISASCGERYGSAIKHGDSWYLTAAQFE